MARRGLAMRALHHSLAPGTQRSGCRPLAVRCGTWPSGLHHARNWCRLPTVTLAAKCARANNTNPIMSKQAVLRLLLLLLLCLEGCQPCLHGLQVRTTAATTNLSLNLANSLEGCSTLHYRHSAGASLPRRPPDGHWRQSWHDTVSSCRTCCHIRCCNISQPTAARRRDTLHLAVSCSWAGLP